MQKLDPRLHFVVVTAVIVKNGKFLIAKRASWEKAFPNKWTVPGGKLVFDEYKNLPTTASYGQWYNLIDHTLRKEVREEVGLEVKIPKYLCDLVFVRPDGYPVVTLSYWTHYKSGKVKLPDALTDYAWVTLKEAKKYDLINGIWDELKMVNELLKTN